MKFAKLFCAAAAVAICGASSAGWDASIETGGREAWLDLPSGKARAVFYTHRNMTEEALIVHPAFAAACERLGIAVMYVAEGDYMWKADEPKGGDGKGSMPTQETFERMLEELAAKTGRAELKSAPVIPFGHSAQATFPWNFAAWNPGRTLCIISFHGDAPRTNLTGYGRENVEWGRTRNIDGIPALMIEGEYEWWEARVRPALAFKMMYPESCISFLCDAERGHFDLSDETADYIVKFIEKSLAARPAMEKLDPAAGWLAARFTPGETERPGAAPAPEYKGDRHDAFWYIDREMAELAEARYARTRGKKEIHLGVKHGGKILPYNEKRHVKIEAPLVLEPDGETFRVGAFFAAPDRKTPAAETPGTKIRVRYVSGPAVETGDGVFRLDRSRLGSKDSSRPRWNGITLCAEAPGNAEFKGAVQELVLTIDRPTIGAPNR